MCCKTASSCPSTCKFRQSPPLPAQSLFFCSLLPKVLRKRKTAGGDGPGDDSFGVGTAAATIGGLFCLCATSRRNFSCFARFFETRSTDTSLRPRKTHLHLNNGGTLPDKGNITQILHTFSACPPAEMLPCARVSTCTIVPTKEARRANTLSPGYIDGSYG